VNRMELLIMIERSIDKIKIVIFVESKYDRDKYVKLFQFLLEDRIEMIRANNHEARIMGDKFLIEFFYRGYGSRGHKAHYVLNLTQDKEFDDCIAKPISWIYTMLKDDPKWSELVVERDDYL
ncbi:hypothetical protein V7094_29040, partial [Priestia megaterium]|uniref:hypothetical protein n=1 Tax=Priestia megaterium TaxID=1404 RepID=UPI002FFF4D72